VDRLVTFREVLSRQQDADMMHDVLRSEVYVAFAQAGRPAQVHAAEVDLGVIRARGERSFVDNGAALATLVASGPSTLTALDSAAADFDRLAASAQATVELVDRARLAEASAARADFDSQFTAVEDEMARLSARLTAASEEAGDTAHAAGMRARSMSILVSLLALVGVGGLGWATWRGVRSALREKAVAEDELRQMMDETAAAAHRHQFGSELGDALEMAETEQDAHRVVAEALAATVPDSPAELLLADSSQASMVRVVEQPTAASPGCPVTSPWSCVAVRRGRTQEFLHGDALNACPQLRDRPSGAVSAACVPVTFMGRPLGVLHTTGREGEAPTAEAADRLSQIAAQAGARIGTLRVTRKTELQAATDGLTGLLNRRSMEAAASGLLQTQTPFAIAMADLDHFKLLNDTYGHEVGDRALRMFANVLRSSLRSEDLVARYGGEEFVVILPGRSILEAGATLKRLRERLSEASQRGGTPAFTASFGLADTEDGTVLEEMLRVADGRLRAAKVLGRDRVVATDSASPADEPGSLV
jgi:diguanylate cyclase (GGDEF)-like protein